jgi:hypothetical protein
MREAREKMAECIHPDPVICHYMPGGSSFMRNPAIPLEVCFPDGIPEGYSKYVTASSFLKDIFYTCYFCVFYISSEIILF